MSGIYLRECLIENVGPISFLDLSLQFNPEGSPKPLILVGQNGSGKTIMLAHVVDALTELAKKAYQDAVTGHQVGHSPYFKVMGSSSVRSGAAFSVGLVEFSNLDRRFCYLEKVGSIAPEQYARKLRGRFERCKSWKPESPEKKVAATKEHVEAFFRDSSVCFFPSSRHERPHWFNPKSFGDSPVFGDDQRLQGILRKPIVVESAAELNRQWLMDVFLDSKTDFELISQPMMYIDSRITLPPIPVSITENLHDKLLLKQSRANVEAVLRAILQDDSAELSLNYRNNLHGRLSIRRGGGLVIPSLDHLSAGESVLFNTFATVIRYADRADLNKSIKLHEIEGVVLIDEIDAHLHTSLQYEVLPSLCKLFPKVQFIITSHAPLFLLGMESAYGNDGIQLVEMPGRNSITTERFSEFKRSFECYQQTKTFEEVVVRSVQEQLTAGSKPLVLTEGKIDSQYIRTALELLDRRDLLDRVDIECVGTAGTPNVSGSGSGKGFLDAALSFLRDNPRFLNRRVLLLYDHDTKKKAATDEKLLVRAIPYKPENTKMEKGIENLLPNDLFDDPYIAQTFVREKERPTGYLVANTFREFDKQAFCDWMCSTRRNPADFEHFSVVIAILEEFLSVSPAVGDPVAASSA